MGLIKKIDALSSAVLSDPLDKQDMFRCLMRLGLSQSVGDAESLNKAEKHFYNALGIHPRNALASFGAAKVQLVKGVVNLLEQQFVLDEAVGEINRAPNYAFWTLFNYIDVKSLKRKIKKECIVLRDQVVKDIGSGLCDYLESQKKEVKREANRAEMVLFGLEFYVYWLFGIPKNRNSFQRGYSFVYVNDERVSLLSAQALLLRARFAGHDRFDAAQPVFSDAMARLEYVLSLNPNNVQAKGIVAKFPSWEKCFWDKNEELFPAVLIPYGGNSVWG